LIWPAAAGNVAWAFFSVVVDPSRDGVEQILLATVLFLLAAYLLLDWVETDERADRLRRYFWIGDAAFAAAIVTFAIGIQVGNPSSQKFLCAVYLTAAVGHLLGFWSDRGCATPKTRRLSWWYRLESAGANLLGLAILWLLIRFGTDVPIALPVSMAVALIGRVVASCRGARPL
jgi:hypothetical protein